MSDKAAWLGLDIGGAHLKFADLQEANGRSDSRYGDIPNGSPTRSSNRWPRFPGPDDSR